MCWKCGPLIKAIDAYIAKADDDLTDALGEEGYLKPKRTAKFLSAIEDDVAEALLEETDYILAEAEKAVDLETFAEDVWPKVKINDALKVKLTTVFTENLDKFMPEFIGYYLAQTDKDLKLAQVSKRTLAWVKSWSEQLGEIMQLNSHKDIERILEKGISDGSGIAEFTRAILDSGIRDEYYKARRVAVTEVLTAHRAAQQEAFMQSPAVAEKMWKHTGEYRNQPRQNHVDMDGKRVPKDEPFELIGADGGIYNPMYPGDPILPPGERINCHCIDQPVVSEEILGLPLEERQRLQQEAIDAMDDEWEKELDAQNRAKAGIEKSDPMQEMVRKATAAVMGVLDQFGIKYFTPSQKRDILKEGWITTEEGNHVYIDSSGNFQGGSGGYQTYQSSGQGAGGGSGSGETGRDSSDRSDGGGSDGSSGSRELEEGEDYISHSSYAPKEYMENMGASEITDDQRDVVEAIIDWEIYDETDGDMMACTTGGYVGSPHSYIINAALRDDDFDSLSDSDKETVKALRDVIDNNQCDTDLLLDRYVRTDVLLQYTGVDPTEYLDKSGRFKSEKAAQEFADAVNREAIGKVTTDKGFVSVSYDPKQNEYYTLPVKMEIAVMPYTHMYVTDNDVESEVILRDGSQFRLCACRAIGKQVCLELGKVES